MDYNSQFNVELERVGTFCAFLVPITYSFNFTRYWGAAVASWLVRSTPDQVIRVRVLAGDIVRSKTLHSQSVSLHPGVLVERIDQ